MLGIVIVTHGKLADGFKDAIETVLGQANNVESLGLYPGADINEFYKDVAEKIEKVQEGQGVIVFTDLVAASPYTQAQRAISTLENKNVALFGNTSFTMLIEAVNAQLLETSLEETVDKIIETAANPLEVWTYQEPSEVDDDDDDF